MKKTTVYDLSGGDEHLREIADESGIPWEVCHSEEETITIGRFEIDVWYNEDASSPWSAWGAFCKGYGSTHGSSREYAIERLFCRVINKLP